MCANIHLFLYVWVSVCLCVYRPVRVCPLLGISTPPLPPLSAPSLHTQKNEGDYQPDYDDWAAPPPPPSMSALFTDLSESVGGQGGEEEGEEEGPPGYRHEAMVGQGIVRPMPKATEVCLLVCDTCACGVCVDGWMDGLCIPAHACIGLISHGYTHSPSVSLIPQPKQTHVRTHENVNYNRCKRRRPCGPTSSTGTTRWSVIQWMDG